MKNYLWAFVLIVIISFGVFLFVYDNKADNNIRNEDIATPQNLNTETLSKFAEYENKSYDELFVELTKATQKHKTRWLMAELNKQDKDKTENKIIDLVKTSKDMEKIKYLGMLSQYKTPKAMNVFKDLVNDNEPGIVNMSMIYLARNYPDEIKNLIESENNEEKKKNLERVLLSVKENKKL